MSEVGDPQQASQAPTAPEVTPAKGAGKTDRLIRWLRQIEFDHVIGVAQLAILAIGIGLALDQSGKVREAIDTATWSSLASQLTEVDQQFVEHPALVPYFYEGATIAVSDGEYMRAYALGVLIIDFMDNAVVMGRHIDPEIFEPDRWEYFYKYQFQQSPIICSIIKEEHAIYGKGIVDRGFLYCPHTKDTGRRPGILPNRPPLPIQ